MKLKQAAPYLLIALLQLVLIFVAFPSFFLHPSTTVFHNRGDGIKNYFTLYSYVKEPIGQGGILKYNSFAWPFGDYVYYTDNTPAFSIPFKWFCTHIHDCSAYTIPVYDFFILANILLAALLIKYIFQRFTGSGVVSFLAALVLPWTNTQIVRLTQGDFNLSYSSLILLALLLFIFWYDRRDNLRRQIPVFLSMLLLVIFSFLMHGYYLAIILSFLSGMLFFAGIFYIKQSFGRQRILYSVLVAAISLSSVMLLLYTTDKYLGLRQVNANGYDWSEQKTNFSLLFTHYSFHSLAFPFSSTKPLVTESMVYLGNAGLFAFLLICVGCLLSTSFRKRFYIIQKEFFSDPLKKSIFFAGLMCLFISFGDWYATVRYPIAVYTPFARLNRLGTPVLLSITLGLALLIYIAILLVSKNARNRLKTIRQEYASHPFKKLAPTLFATVIVYLFVAQFVATIPNLLNPFFYLHFITRRVEQFRSLARFAWPFFWTFYIWVMYTIVQLYYGSRKWLKITIAIVILLPAATEVCDYIINMRDDANRDNYFSAEHFPEVKPQHIDFSKYQAILPIPFYMVGSEDYGHTIDEEESWGIRSMQISLYSHLPLMACKMSRTPPEFSVMLLNMVENDSLAPALLSKLGDKPILVAYNKAAVRVTPPGNEVVDRINKFPQRHHLIPIDSLGHVVYYSWSP